MLAILKDAASAPEETYSAAQGVIDVFSLGGDCVLRFALIWKIRRMYVLRI
jgi:hypothetical protein